MNREIVAVVLAGGTGTRFWPFQTDKNLFPFLDKKLFNFSVVSALPPEVNRIVVVANTDNYDYFTNLDFGKPKKVVIQKDAKGMADALNSVKEYVQNSSLLIMIADHLVDPNLCSQVIARAKKTGVFGVLPGWKVSSYFPGGYLKLDGEKITGIAEKPGAGNTPSSYVYISGTYIENSDELFAVMDKTTSSSDDVYEKTLTNLMQNHDFIMEPYQGISSTLKYPWDVLNVMDDLLKTRVVAKVGKNVIIKNNVVIEGNVEIADNVKIFENSKIVGPCYIGENTIVGNNNIIRDSCIGADCVTGFNTDITRSYIGNDCWFHSNYVGDSILENNISMGSGTVLANLRLDEGNITSAVKGVKIDSQRNKLGSCIGSNVRIGVNVSVMPGIKIGSNSMIGAGSVIAADIPNDTFCFTKSSLELKKNTQKIISDRDSFKQKIT